MQLDQRKIQIYILKYIFLLRTTCPNVLLIHYSMNYIRFKIESCNCIITLNPFLAPAEKRTHVGICQSAIALP